MTAAASILRDAGLHVLDFPVPGRGHQETRAIMLHHDAVGPTTASRWIAMAQHGRPDLKGPLYGAGVLRDGRWCLITHERANHAGSCSYFALQEAFDGRAPDRDARDRALLDDTTIGNRYTFGICAANNGVGEPYPDAQIDSLARGVAALCEAWGLTAGHVLHHRQATRRKIDMSYRGPLRGLIQQHQEDIAMALPTVVGHDPFGQWYRVDLNVATPISAEAAARLRYLRVREVPPEFVATELDPTHGTWKVVPR